MKRLMALLLALLVLCPVGAGLLAARTDGLPPWPRRRTERPRAL